MSFDVLGKIANGGFELPLCTFKVPAGFPSPTAVHIEKHISLDEVLNIRAPHVCLVVITGECMQGAGIFEGDLAVVDRSIEPLHGHIVVELLNNDPMCKRLCKRGTEVILLSENPKYPALCFGGRRAFNLGRDHQHRAQSCLIRGFLPSSIATAFMRIVSECSGLIWPKLQSSC